MQNPLIPEILTLLHRNPNGISEHLILKALKDHTGFTEIADQGHLALFQKHFMVMNALYQLQNSLWNEEQLTLKISPLQIQLHPCDRQGNLGSLALAESTALRSYYLDWHNFKNTSEEEVSALLHNFWRRFINTDDRAAAMQALNLKFGASADEITRRYRELAAIHHPDKGGTQETFIHIRQAFEVLREY
ncbi:DNA-J related domain-containing protein [Sulfurirhabdus autotrophica]|uniref:DnaJ-like protein n=1 Tax=Sulfurirhabdus autotrophica TaxID=1706046 RepID=A0A4R3XX70_9PROT|nr:DNA-J related domain-containing protein [Sulfurirhabdus autotrophica]TCV82334.1 DnaJ-like protein [Sulfurirhabdus autotrophica]